jgi:hypothetical protein
MTSVVSEFKQIPRNAGYFVCLSGATNVGFAVSGETVASSATVTVTTGVQYIDLGVTRKVAGVKYRKVVAYTSPLNVSGTEFYILIDVAGAGGRFARMG